MMIEKLEAGKFIQVSKESSKELGYCQVFDVLENNTIAIFTPIDKNIPLNLRNRDVVTLLITEKVALYEFEGIVSKKSHKGRKDIIEIKLTGKFKKTQRREFFRLEKEVSITLNDIGDYKTMDISGGGFCVYTDEEILIDKLVSGFISLPCGNIFFVGKVVRGNEITDMKTLNKKYDIGVKFVEIDERDREHIFEFIMKEQIASRRRN